MCRAVMFGSVVAKVSFAGSPEKFELFLCFMVSEPIEFHGHCLSLPWLNVGSDNPECWTVISLCWGWWLWMTRFLEQVWNGDLFHGHWCTMLRDLLRCLWHDGFDELCNVEYGSIVGPICCVRWHEKMTSGLTACLWFAQVRCITVNDQYHVACMVSEYSLLMCSCIIKEKFDACHCCFGWFSLCKCNGAWSRPFGHLQ